MKSLCTLCSIFLILYHLEAASDECQNSKARLVLERSISEIEFKMQKHLLNSNYKLVDLDFEQAKIIKLFSRHLKAIKESCTYDFSGAICSRDYLAASIKDMRNWQKTHEKNICYDPAKTLSVK